MLGTISRKFTRAEFIIFFVFALICIVMKGLWLPLAYLASGVHAPHFIIIKTWLWFAAVVGLVTYFKWPWLLAIVTWVDMVMVMTGVFPWEEQGLQNLFYQFIFDLLLFAAANFGLISYIFSRRQRQAQEPITGNQQTS
jgi:hypothetical protein